MTDRLPYSRQSIDDDDIAAVTEVLRSDFLTTGPRVAQFEGALAEFTGAAHAVAVSSGTAALHAAYAVLGIGPGDEVVMPPMTFAATANAALYLGARPVFIDVDPVTGLLDPACLESAITSRTRAIVAVDYAGQPADYAAIRAIARRHGLPIVADAAHSIGASRDGVPVGHLADLTVLSFHPVKHFTTGEGGAVLTADPALAENMRAFRNHGITRDEKRMRRMDGPWYHEMQGLGFNYRLTDIQSVLGTSQLRRLPGFIARRREIAARYLVELQGLPGLDLPVVLPGAEHSWHLFVVRVSESTRRRAFFDSMTQRNLGVQVHYMPVYRHPYYEDLGYAEGLCPGAEDLYSRAVSIPLFPAMTDLDVDRVIDGTGEVARRVLAEAIV
jgi:UDP-4-amino-4,6-dideoxy-N-acetyl-beta-L-altrosamine transaminase